MLELWSARDVVRKIVLQTAEKSVDYSITRSEAVAAGSTLEGVREPVRPLPQRAAVEPRPR